MPATALPLPPIAAASSEPATPARGDALPRVLVIVSSDYGELGSAMYFLQGLPPGATAQIALPPNLSHALPDTPALPVRTYGSFAQLREHVAAARPDAVMLFSGYLLTIGRRFSMLNTWRLLRLLARMRVPVLTSDPFVGLAARPGGFDFRWVLGGTRWARWQLAKRLSARIHVAEFLLRGGWHVYPSPYPPQLAPRGVRTVSWCSDALHSPTPREPQEQARWLFVLSEVDCRMQLQRDPGFPALLAGRLRDTRRLGKQPVLIAPAALADAVRPQLAGVDATLLTQPPYHEFMAHLMAAEQALYWNWFSFSLIHRVLAGLPVLWFAEGHMMRIVPGLREVGLQVFYGGWAPPLLDVAQPLTLEGVARAGDEASEHFAAIARRLRECAPPAEVLARALASAQDGTVRDPVA